MERVQREESLCQSVFVCYLRWRSEEASRSNRWLSHPSTRVTRPQRLGVATWPTSDVGDGERRVATAALWSKHPVGPACVCGAWQRRRPPSSLAPGGSGDWRESGGESGAATLLTTRLSGFLFEISVIENGSNHSLWPTIGNS